MQELVWASQRKIGPPQCLPKSFTHSRGASERLLSVRCSGRLGLCSVSFRAASPESLPGNPAARIFPTYCELSGLRWHCTAAPICHAVVSVSCTLITFAKPESRELSSMPQLWEHCTGPEQLLNARCTPSFARKDSRNQTLLSSVHTQHSMYISALESSQLCEESLIAPFLQVRKSSLREV